MDFIEFVVISDLAFSKHSGKEEEANGKGTVGQSTRQGITARGGHACKALAQDREENGKAF